MTIYITADHNGFEMKNDLKRWLEEEGYTVEDYGPTEFVKEDDYPDYAFKTAQAVSEDPKNRYGILLCGSGVGMAVAANKVPNIRAALVHDPAIAKAAQRDDDINMLVLGATYISLDTAKNVITNWLTTPFSNEERHVRRISKITNYEQSR